MKIISAKWGWLWLVSIMIAVVTVFILHAYRMRDLAPVGEEPSIFRSHGEIPSGTIVLNAVEAVAVEPPLAIKNDGTAAGGLCLWVPDSGGYKVKEKGMAVIPFGAETEGLFHAWIRVLWRDSCGNSFAVQLDDARPFTAGQDNLFGVWHWVRAGCYTLTAGEHRLTVLGREDGAAFDQFLLTPDQDFKPMAPVLPEGGGVGLRRFADNFDRSPGHGLGPWTLVLGDWQISFSLDPNRIPYQYSLHADAAAGKGLLLLDEPPWNGQAFSFNVLPFGSARFGVILDRDSDGQGLQVDFSVGEAGGQLHVTGDGLDRMAPLGQGLETGQWHRVTVDRWAWTIRVAVNGATVLEDHSLEPAEGGIGLWLEKGSVLFDDVVVRETPWQIERPGLAGIAWQRSKDARWYRILTPGTEESLVGWRGSLIAGLKGLPIEEIRIKEQGPALCRVEAPGLVPQDSEAGFRLLVRENPWRPGPEKIRFIADGGKHRIQRIAIRYGQPEEDAFRFGLYHFTDWFIEDPSDYLDFTPEEYEIIRTSPDANKLMRQPRKRPLVERRGDESVWIAERGKWDVRDGVLWGQTNAVLRWWQDINTPLTCALKVRLPTSSDAVEFEFYEGAGSGIRIRLETGAAGMKDDSQAGDERYVFRLPSAGEWHPVRMQFEQEELRISIGDKDFPAMNIQRGLGGGVLFRVANGTAQFDDVEITSARKRPGELLYAFDRREPDWRRVGGEWMDHGGIACALSSSWVSLVAPQGEGMLWNRRKFSPDLMVGFNVEENSEWFGWTQRMSHVHYPFDNVRVVLGEGEDLDRGYRLEVNSQNRSRTVLFRNGQEVASVAQVRGFPVRFRGGHAPYNPRRLRIVLVKQGALIRAMLEGKEVLRFEDPDPIPVSTVGLGGYLTRANFTQIAIREL